MCRIEAMDPNDSKDAELAPKMARDAQPAAAPPDIGFNESELRQMSAAVDLEVLALLNLC